MLRLSRPFQRFLSIIESGDREALQLLAELRGTVVVGDYSDAAPPHQNPVFGAQTVRTPTGGQFAGFELLASTRPLRLRELLIATPAGGTVRVAVATASGLTVQATIVVRSLGPHADANNTDTATGILTTGSSVIPYVGLTNAYEPLVGETWVPPLPLLLAPGERLLIGQSAASTLLSVGMVWEELPRFGEVSTFENTIGYPNAND